MKSLKLPYMVSLAAAAVLVTVPHPAAAQEQGGAVFAMTNAASNNQINAYSRHEDGSLEFSGHFRPAATAVEALSIRCTRKARSR